MKKQDVIKATIEILGLECYTNLMNHLTLPCVVKCAAEKCFLERIDNNTSVETIRKLLSI